MKTTDFTKRIKNDLQRVAKEHSGRQEDMKEQLQQFQSVFHYGAWCERNFERNLREDYTRKTTFTSDLSIGEWCGGAAGVIDTLRRALEGWHMDITFFAELLLAVNLKSWEHYARKNPHWSALYADLYYVVRDLYMDWYDDKNPKHEEAMQYYMDWID